jgi:NAD+ synthase
MNKKLNVCIAQINPVVGDLSGNLEKIRRALDDCPAGTDLVIYPEMATCGYPPEDLVLKPFFLSQVEKYVQKLAVESASHNKYLILPTPWRIKGKVDNAALLIGEGKIIARTAKHVLPNYGVFDELRIFTPGPLPEPVEFKGCRLGIMICEDMWYQEPAKNLRENEADLLLVLNASPYEGTKNITRLDVARARAEETGLPLLYVNQVGGQDELVFDGASFAIDEQGRILLQMEEFEEALQPFAIIKPEGEKWFFEKGPVKPEPENIESIYKALVLGLADYVGKNGFPGVLIGLSGGIDSALCATIAKDALGADRVRCILMPSPFTSAESIGDAQELAENLGVSLDRMEIGKAMETFRGILSPHISENAPETTFENIQSRCRGLLLMALSNSSGYMVVSTGNKSEMATGYATLYGDMCGGFNPLKDIYKTQVYELARWRNREKQIIPGRIITKPPSAELKPGQTDQDTLPPYGVLDDILACLIEKDLGISDIVKRGHSEDIVRKVWRLLDVAEYKRRQAPPGIKITSRAFGRDRRYPVTNHFTGSILPGN